jgi:hypothetical protein
LQVKRTQMPRGRLVGRHVASPALASRAHGEGWPSIVAGALGGEIVSWWPCGISGRGSGFCHGVTRSPRLSPKESDVCPMWPPAHGFSFSRVLTLGGGRDLISSHLGERRESRGVVARFCVPLPSKLVTPFSVWSEQSEWDPASAYAYFRSMCIL